MKDIFSAVLIATVLFTAACNSGADTTAASAGDATTPSGQSAVQDDVSMKDVVKVAVASKDHTTLVAAVKQAGLVDVLSNAGPFTVFAPTNDAFNKLPTGTVENLMKNENKEALTDVLQYHVTTSSLKPDYFEDGQTINMVNGGTITVQVKDGKIILNNSVMIVGSAMASNGMVHIVAGVLLPPAKK